MCNTRVMLASRLFRIVSKLKSYFQINASVAINDFQHCELLQCVAKKSGCKLHDVMFNALLRDELCKLSCLL